MLNSAFFFLSGEIRFQHIQYNALHVNSESIYMLIIR